MLRFLLLVFAVVVLALLAFDVITTYQFRWQCGALAAFVLSFLNPPNTREVW